MAARMLLQGLNGSWNRDVPFSGAGGRHKKGTQYVASTGLPQPLLPPCSPAAQAAMHDQLSPLESCTKRSGACCLEQSAFLCCRHAVSVRYGLQLKILSSCRCPCRVEHAAGSSFGHGCPGPAPLQPGPPASRATGAAGGHTGADGSQPGHGTGARAAAARRTHLPAGQRAASGRQGALRSLCGEC